MFTFTRHTYLNYEPLMKRTYGIVSKPILYPLITALNCTPSYGIVMCTGASTHSHLIPHINPNIFILIESRARESAYDSINSASSCGY